MSTEQSAAFTGAPASVLDVKGTEQGTVLPADGGLSGAPIIPIPSGVAPTQRAKVKAAGAAKAPAAKRGRGRPKKAVPTAQVVDAAAEAAASALERETAAKRGPGRPSKAETENALLEAGLVNFYVGIGGLLAVGGLALRNARLRDVGSAMIAQARDCATALVAAAEQSSALRKALEYVTMAGGASLVIAAHGPIIMAAMGQGVQAMPTVDQVPETGEPIPMDLGSLMNMASMLFAQTAEPAA